MVRAKFHRFRYALMVMTITPAVALAGPINSDVAFTPREGGSILRLQYTYSEADRRDGAPGVQASGARAVLIHGVTKDLALILAAPFVHREIDVLDPGGSSLDFRQDGLADVTLIAKYRFWQRDVGPLHTLRWAVLGGINIRSGDSDVTSDSYDPILGAVFSWRRDRKAFDADLLYQLNTGGGRSGHDALRYDLAYSYRLVPETFRTTNPYSIRAVAELNGRYLTDGSHEVFLAPGLQLAMPRWVLEASLQLPVVQELADHMPQDDYRIIVGLRFQW